MYKIRQHLSDVTVIGVMQDFGTENKSLTYKKHLHLF